ncbi:MAG TPA: helix-turn-helix domain-containing protein [Steroidobacteraceae bacterium]|nr:helix-turn-helix domain-containing protein [Steroidobacteraceae bacterium]
MIVNRWSSRQRTLSSAEVDGRFAEAAHELLVFDFTTDRMHVGRHGGHFSLKLVTRGAEHYRFGRRRVVLEPGQLLLVNQGERYESSIDTPATRALSVFVPRAAVQESAPHHEVFSVPFRPGPELRARVRDVERLLMRVPDDDAGAQAEGDARQRLEVGLLELTSAAIGQNLGLRPHNLGRKAPRVAQLELLRRLLRAREYLEDVRGAATLEQCAAVACLSRFHFLRSFTDAFGITPARFARDLRLQAGRRSLREGSSPSIAARAAGYRSASAFLRALRTQVRPGNCAISARRAS